MENSTYLINIWAFGIPLVLPPGPRPSWRSFYLSEEAGHHNDWVWSWASQRTAEDDPAWCPQLPCHLRDRENHGSIRKKVDRIEITFYHKMIQLHNLTHAKLGLEKVFILLACSRLLGVALEVSFILRFGFSLVDLFQYCMHKPSV